MGENDIGSSEGREYYLVSDQLTVRFGEVVALNSFSTNIPTGIVGLLGPNGAGKSTFIKASLGLVAGDSGELTVKGLDPRKDTTRVRDMIGYMPEHDCLISSMNSVELVSYMGRLSGLSSKDAIQRTHEVLGFIGIGEERYRPIESYSTGMKQRVKLAQAIVHDPGILFLDEPTNGMDPQGREEMLDLIQKIGASGKTILVSSHILQEVERFSDYVVIINDGVQVEAGPIKELMGADGGRVRIKIRGEAEALARFEKALDDKYEVLSRSEEGGQLTLVVSGVESSKWPFELAMENIVQLRYYAPDTLSLEDVFVRAFEGGETYAD